jgi:hypothetical protein
MSTAFVNRDDDDDQNLTPQQVMAMMQSWSPEAREKAAKLLEDVLAGHLRA